MTDIVLVRHGETTWHAKNRYAGRKDVPLTDRGLEQAQHLARWARSAGLTGVWSSDLSRSVDTAQPSADATGLELKIDARLRELDFGEAEGLTRADMKRTMPEALDAFMRDPVAHHLPGGEDPNAAAKRGLECLHEVAAADVDGRVLIVCHTTLIRLMFCSILSLPLAEYRRLLPYLHNGFLNELRMRDGQVAILSWNAPPDDRRKVDDP